MTANLADIGFLEERGIRHVECIVPDITGFARGKLMPARSFAARGDLRMARAVLMQTVTGEYPEDPVLLPDSDPDTVLRPDLDTFRIVPWASEPRALAIHDCLEFDGSLCRFSSRSLLRGVITRYERAGLKPVVAPEIEFYLLQPPQDVQHPFQMPRWPAGTREVGQSAFGIGAIDGMSAFWQELFAALDTLGVQADTWIHEMGPSQFEINLLHGDALALADQAFLFKYATRQIAAKHGYDAVFMSKPLRGQPGSSMHLHQSVVDAQGHNIFSNADGSASDCFGHFLGGLQTYLPDMMLVFAPFINSFRRYVAHSQAPSDLSIGHDDREAGLRIPRSAPAARRVENRLAGADVNPYLVIAATLAAGLAGMEEALSPTTTPPTSASPALNSLPNDFLSAHRRLAASATAPRLLEPDFVKCFLLAKQVEYDSFLAEISPWEHRYLGPMA